MGFEKIRQKSCQRPIRAVRTWKVGPGVSRKLILSTHPSRRYRALSSCFEICRRTEVQIDKIEKLIYGAFHKEKKKDNRNTSTSRIGSIEIRDARTRDRPPQIWHLATLEPPQPICSSWQSFEALPLGVPNMAVPTLGLPHVHPCTDINQRIATNCSPIE